MKRLFLWTAHALPLMSHAALAAPPATAGIVMTYGRGNSSSDALKVANVDRSNLQQLANDSDDLTQPKGVAVDAINYRVYVADASISE